MNKEYLRKELYKLRLALKLTKDDKEKEDINKRIDEAKNEIKNLMYEERKEENDKYQRR